MSATLTHLAEAKAIISGAIQHISIQYSMANAALAGATIGVVEERGLTSNSTEALNKIQKILGIIESDWNTDELFLNKISDHLEDLSLTERRYVLSQLTDSEMEVLFNNVHHSGLLTNDWGAGKELEFYKLLGAADDNTLARIEKYSPLPPEFLKIFQGASEVEINDDVAWNSVDIGHMAIGSYHLHNEKISFIESNRDAFIKASEFNGITPRLLGGIGYEEFGMRLDISNEVADSGRTLNKKLESVGLDFVGNIYSEFDKDPNLTSHGNMSMQVRRMIETLGFDPETLSGEERKFIIEASNDTTINIFMTGSHVRDIIDIHYPGLDPSEITDQQIQNIGGWYRHGPEYSYEELRKREDAGYDYGRNVLFRSQDAYEALYPESNQKTSPTYNY